MTYQPVIVGTGMVAWKFLERTYETQRQSYDSSAVITRDTEYFEANIAEIKTAEDLVNDRRLLRVALGAFGLQDDINNTYFIKKVLEDGTIADDALSNKLSDKRYHEMALAFGFDLSTPRTVISDFGANIVEKYRAQSFEVAIGEQDNNMRLAMNAIREVEELAGKEARNDTKWFEILGNTALRSVFQTALGLPSSFAQIDIDQQLVQIKEKAEAQFGTSDLTEFADEGLRDELVKKFLVRAQLADVQTSSSAQITATLLSGAINFAYSLRNR